MWERVRDETCDRDGTWEVQHKIFIKNGTESVTLLGDFEISSYKIPLYGYSSDSSLMLLQIDQAVKWNMESLQK